MAGNDRFLSLSNFYRNKLNYKDEEIIFGSYYAFTKYGYALQNLHEVRNSFLH